MFAGLQRCMTEQGIAPDWDGPERPHAVDARPTPWALHALQDGEKDPFHGWFHASAAVDPTWDSHRGEPRWSIDASSNIPRATLMLGAFSGWYSHLAQTPKELPKRSRSWRVDVLIQPFGWMGTYRQSRVTGRWFTGPHRAHMLGYPHQHSG
ncbi:hypothetical protein GCM10009763_28240 [Dermacoccus profundi]